MAMMRIGPSGVVDTCTSTMCPISTSKIPVATHAGTDDTSEIMFIDEAQKWIRRDKLARSDSTQQCDRC